jgi:hypothetical protein
MGTQEIRNEIQRLLRTYKFKKEGLFYIDGNPRELWFIMHNLDFGTRFNKSKTSVMVRYKNNSDWPVIFVPNYLKARKDGDVCNFIFEESTPVKGWKLLCTIMLHYTKEDFLTFAPSFGKFLANKRVCYPFWCEEQREKWKNLEMYFY